MNEECDNTFSGSFDAESRFRFREKREKHGLSRNALAKLLGVDEVTIKRWECGPTQKVTGPAQEIIADFLSGKLENRLTRTGQSERKVSIPIPLQKRFEKLARIYVSCSAFPELQKEMLQKIKSITDN